MALSVKMALLLIIARVFGSVHKKTIMGIYIFMGLLGGYYFSALVVKIRVRTVLLTLKNILSFMSWNVPVAGN